MTAKYQRVQMSKNPDFKKFGMNPDKKDEIDNQEYKYGKSDNKERRNLSYLTNRKPKKTLLERMYHAMCCCFITPDDPDPEEEDEPETGNAKIIDLLIFSENNWIYYLFSLFVSFLCLFSVYYYLYICAGRFHEVTDETMIWGYEFYLFVTLLMEMVFFVDMILLFFKEYTPVG